MVQKVKFMYFLCPTVFLISIWDKRVQFWNDSSHPARVGDANREYKGAM